MLHETTSGGYRVLRGLGRGDRAEVLLAAGEGDPVALKRFLPHVPLGRVLLELDAIERIDAPHLPRVLDLATGDDGEPVVVLERWSPFTLGALLARRGTIAAGEAVTLLAPIAETVERMHAAGVAHGALVPGAVHLAVDGAPVLGGLGALSRFADGPASEAVRSGSQEVARDAQALTALAAIVAEHLDGAGAGLRRRIEEFAAAVGDEPQRRSFELLEVLFGAAPAAAVRFPGAGRRVAERPSAAMPARLDAPPPGERDVEPSGAGPVGWLAAAQLPEWLERLVDAEVGAVQRWAPVRRLRRSIASVRPRFRVLGAIAVVTLLALGGVVLQRADGQRENSAAATPPETTSSHDPRPEPSDAAARDAAGVRDGDAPRGAAGPDALDAAITGDDALAAASALLASRDDCLRRAEHTCLDGVLQAGSALLAEDRARVDATQRDGVAAELLGAPADLRIVQELGGAVLVAAAFPDAAPQTTAASLLIVRSEAGWRLRDLL
ncbi:hypothetical protein [Arenivirga flava]|uniref:Protein kinase domain-containing protein n=1 Tax=Arenivirga flava TaxID=1930060 RepID=A0AA37XBP4_9MICO|nr:hypothetical protein [Arenivirga flava]GMA27677.1 hypothetical protein GCM10025874_09300 [Arenivirga flava]